MPVRDVPVRDVPVRDVTGVDVPGVDVIVVGAGVAGLVAATALAAGGTEVVCLEARPRVGGRTLSTGGWMDLGATWFWDGEPAVAELVASLGLRRYPQAIAGDALFERADGDVARLAGNPIDVPAWRVEGGMQSLALQLAGRLPDGVVRTGAAVESVTFEAGGPVRVKAGEREIVGRAVLLAMPPKLAVESIVYGPALPPEVVRAAAVHTWMSDMVKAVASFEQPFWREAGLSGAAFSHAGPFRELHDHSGPAPDQAAIFGFAPAPWLEDAPADVVAERFVAQLVRLWGPDAGEPSAVHVVDWSRERFTATPGSVGSSASWHHQDRVLRVPYMEGRLAFASTETADAFAGHLEGAILAGRRAAGHALALLDPRSGEPTGSSKRRARGGTVPS